MSVVYVLGAGTSYGDRIVLHEGAAAQLARRLSPPPLVRGFFRGDLYEHLGYAGASAAADFAETFEYIRALKHAQEAVGTGAWNEFDLEEIFTSVELEREFWQDQSDEHSRLTIVRNKLVRYIGRIIALCTQGGYGEGTRQLAASLGVGDSVLTFNWDLLLDNELDPRGNRWQYKNFFSLLLKDFRFGNIIAGPYGQQALLLKLHGSLNWFLCTNRSCYQSSAIAFVDTVDAALERAMGIGSFICDICGSEMNPLLVPPLLRKPIHDNPIIRAMWGTARRRLESATKVVVMGFSLAPTDFYASWLLRSIQNQGNPQVQIFVVNPMNDPEHAEHERFRQRMLAVFPRGYNEEFTSFAEILQIIERVRQEN